MHTSLPMSRLATALVIALSVTAPLAAQAGDDYNDEHFWSAQPEGTAWVNNYDECWQSLHGDGDLSPCTKAAPVAAVPKEFTVRLNFEFDKYQLSNIVNDNELRRLDDYITQVKETPTREQISLTGHTDAKGSDEYNYRLGQRRAETVREYMVSKGVPASDIVSVKSRGKQDMIPGVDIYSVEQRRVKINAEYDG
ncbi:flagellar motor protein MotB [Chromatium okenii]|uniref:OmpA family protein n=1 Tax=Chromatium okenii TaxID=61644 RepID=UPI001907357B|nr:OmpA family protein [Chromatium okenii]MBK1641088.1 flagellar motor protein MotB [Chromatium okenii]